MNLRECYEAMGGDYDDVIGRLRKEQRVEKFIRRFAEDPSCDLLRRSAEAGDWAEAFRAAHTLKGVCQNLSLTRLGNSSSQLTEALRSGYTPEVDQLLPVVYEDHRRAVAAIAELSTDSAL